MNPAQFRILAVNCGSSSIRFALYGFDPGERRLLSARFDGIGLGQGRFEVRDEEGRVAFESLNAVADHGAASVLFAGWMDRHGWSALVDGVGHRVVHGGARFAGPAAITGEVEEAIARLRKLDPAPQVPELAVLRALRPAFAGVPHVACFDTSFHRQMPPVAQRHPLPRQLEEQGMLRFGSHGISCESVLQQLASIAGADAAQGRIVIAHLGDGASMAAVHEGRSLDSTTGFMPNGGLMMGTRSGDLCPGSMMHLLLGKGMSVAEVNTLMNCESGLLGVSGVSRDMRELLRVSSTNPWAAEAVELFCYTAKKHLGSLAAVLGGVDTLVFTGGIGENAPLVRRSICERMDHIGIRLDPARNRRGESVISADGSPVAVRVVATNEELVIARAAAGIIRSGTRRAAGPV
jgi:acetate kinase